MILTTERIHMRPFRKEDCDDLYAIYSDEKTCRYLLHHAWQRDECAKEVDIKIAENELTEDRKLSLAVVLGERVIGDISLWYTGMKDTVEIGYVFNDAYKGHGYAYEAVKHLIAHLFYERKIHRIQANMDARNHASARLCQRLGMRKEAHFIQDYWNKGEWTDSFVYGMLRDDLEKAMANDRADMAE